ncbi:DNA (cytosine-5-)-methyltransferase [Candidatus Pacearchaeota archaeon CG10_big_fil_rev_8_21_14_0_10_34_76]|nr:MAG: DNA (cytosine-5-)-methyltransferase [Candidatus Pacearchaeota archaeon CG10_big_fil_rev_8_21_14_0_10_34_76]
MVNKKLVAVDLFCGAGGLTRGLSEAGISVLKGYDFDEKASETYEKNNKNSKFFHIDVVNLKKEELMNGIDRKNNFFLLAGCAPCQPFSLINQKEIGNDERKNLVLKFGKLIEETLPDFVFMENVPGLVNGKGEKIFKKFLGTLDESGYNYDFKILNVMNYGVPQRRKRLVVVASKKSKIKIPESMEEFSKKNSNVIKLREVLGKYPPIIAGEKHSKIPNHEARGLSKINLNRLKLTRKNGGSRTDLPKEYILECHKKHKGHTDVYGRMSFDNVSPTLTCKCTSISNGRFGHPTQNRAISVREAAAIQTFPDDYVFYGNMTDNTKWVGNAVPVKFAKVFGEYFINLAKF